MIYDLDAGRPERRGGSSLRMTAVTVVAVGIALAFFTALAFAPGQRASQTPILTFAAPALPTMARPTFNTKPVPDRTLVLSGDEAVETFRITSLGQTGLVRNDAVATTYRLRATGDLVTVAPLPQSEALPYSAPLVNRKRHERDPLDRERHRLRDVVAHAHRGAARGARRQAALT